MPSTAPNPGGRPCRSSNARPPARQGAQLRKQRDELAALMTAEMGKPVAEARAEVEKSATACDDYAENGPSALAPQTVDLLKHSPNVTGCALAIEKAVP